MDHRLKNPMSHPLKQLIVQLFDHHVIHRLAHLLHGRKAEPDARPSPGRKTRLKRVDGVVTTLNQIVRDSRTLEHILKSCLKRLCQMELIMADHATIEENGVYRHDHRAADHLAGRQPEVHEKAPTD
jgi:hypothetical protein